LNGFVSFAYAQEAISPEVEKAAIGRRDRKAELNSWEEKGVIGENRLGLVEIRKQESSNSALNSLVNAENSDRMVIYQSIAKKNGTQVEEVQKLYAKRIQNDAPSGTPIENESGWSIK
jgi:uncharacterized protein YdbL (DUF1318 family)